MPKFMIMFNIVYGLVQLYLYVKLRRLCSADYAGFFGWFWLIVSIAVIVLPAKEIAQSFDADGGGALFLGIGFAWLGFALLLAFVFCCYDLIGFIGRLVGFSALSHFFRAPAILYMTIGVIGIAIGYGAYAAQQVNVVSVALPTTKLPLGADRFRIVLLSDLHLNPLFRGKKLAEIMTAVRNQNPDVVVVAGDTVDRNMAGYGAEADLLSRSGSKRGVFAIEGNHEHYAGFSQALDFLNQAKMTVLRNEIVEVGPITIIGETDPARGPEAEPPLSPIDYSKLKLSKDRFVLLLKHRPAFDPAISDIVDLQLSGHTHRGQIWPAYWVTRWVFDYLPGLSKWRNTWVYVSNGTGFWGPPVRLFAPPEITVIDLTALGHDRAETATQ